MTSRDNEIGKTAKFRISPAGSKAREIKENGKAPFCLGNGRYACFEVLGDRGVEDQALKISNTQFHLRLGIISDSLIREEC